MPKKTDAQPNKVAEETKKKEARKSTIKKTTPLKSVEIAEVKDEEHRIIETQKEKAEKTTNGINRGALLFGLGLLLMGVILLVGELIGFRFSEYLWPFLFIIPGALLFTTSLSAQKGGGEGLAIFGGILCSLGGVFLLQAIFKVWASWAYAWALVAPTSIGVAQMIYGSAKDLDAIVQSGKRVVNVGLTLFFVGFVFFEVVLDINQLRMPLDLPRIPVGLILIGLFILIKTIFSKK